MSDKKQKASSIAKKKLNEVEGRSLTPHTHTHTVQQKRVVRVTTDWSRTNIYRLTIIDVVGLENLLILVFLLSNRIPNLAVKHISAVICRRIKILLQ